MKCRRNCRKSLIENNTMYIPTLDKRYIKILPHKKTQKLQKENANTLFRVRVTFYLSRVQMRRLFRRHVVQPSPFNRSFLLTFSATISFFSLSNSLLSILSLNQDSCCYSFDDEMRQQCLPTSIGNSSQHCLLSCNTTIVNE